MNATANPIELLQYITQPAFLVKDGIVTDANEAATARQISIGTPILELIKYGAEDYHDFSSGKLYLALKSGRAWVSICDGFHLFSLEDNFTSPELRAFALAAQHLRSPLSSALSGTDMIMQNVDPENADLKEQLSQVNRSLYQMIRAICNMSDVSQIGITNGIHTEVCSASYIFQEIFEKASHLTEDLGCTIQFQNLKQDIACEIDASLMERAVLNLISNALKFSPAGSGIRAVLKQQGNRISLSIENSIMDGYSGAYGNAFKRFLREPGIESGRVGIGLGMSVVSGVVSAHNGTVLLNLSRKGLAKVTISVPIRTNGNATARSPIILLDGYTGGIDNYLVELSDILPAHFYENI